MGVSALTLRFLAGAGHDALHVRDLGMLRAEDGKILARAKSEERTVLTFDLDFPDLLAASSDRLPSVVLFRLEDERPASVNRWLAPVLRDHGAALQAGAVIVVAEGRVRVRHLPIHGGP